MAPTEVVDPFLYYQNEPAPMGIADFGVGDSGAYQYATNSTLGIVSIGSLSTMNSTGSDAALSIQLNVNLKFTSSNQLFVYWIQDVAQLDSNNNTIQFLDNVWNFSSSSAAVGFGISGNGQLKQFTSSESFYYDVASSSLPGNGISLSYPSTVSLEVNATTSASREPELLLAYNDGFGWVTFDRVTFTSASHLDSLTGFTVDGFTYNPVGVYYDSELVLVGECCAWSANDIQSDVNLQLDYWNGNNYQEVTNAYNFGSDSGETMGNVLSTYGHYQANGQPVAEFQAGAGSLGVLYTRTQVGTLSIASPIGSGVLDIRNLTDSGAPPSQTGFVSGNVTVVLSPGSYLYQVYAAGVLYRSGNATISAGGSVHVNLIPPNTIPLVLSYSVKGGYSGSSGPVLKYAAGGVALTGVLTTSPSVYHLDSGSSWSVSSLLPGSSLAEKWSTASPTSGIVSSAQTIEFVYYHQFRISVVLVSVGGSPNPFPTFTFTSLGRQSALSLTTTPQSLWADDGSEYSVPAQIESSAQERWFTAASSGTVEGSTALTFTYYHQFLLTITGAGLASAWYDSGVEAQVRIPGVFLRSAGEGQRVTSYSIDNGTLVEVQPTSNTLTVAVTMDAPHALLIDAVTQFQVVLEPSIGAAFVSITPPTIAGDNYWYDSGSRVQLVLDGVWGRSDGTGERLASFTVNGGTTAVATAGRVDALDISFLQSPQDVSVTSVIQHQLTIVGGSVASITQPTVPGDFYWYDSGKMVSAAFSYSWNSTSTSRTNAVGYAVGKPGALTPLKRSGTGTFTLSVAMTAPEAVTISAVTQYTLNVSGGNGVVFSSASPTGDGFYDAGTNTSVTTNNVWGVVNGDTRQNLESYSLDGSTVNVTRSGTGTYTVPAILFDSSQVLSFNSITQYLIGFQFKDASGSTTIRPASLEIELGNSIVETVLGLEIWLDSGASFRVWSVTWEGASVGPQNPAIFTASGPANETVNAQVYKAKLAVVDILGIPVSGAVVTATFDNGTVVRLTTPGNGTVDFGLIPKGTFLDTVSYFGFSTSFTGDASRQTLTTQEVFASYPTLTLVIAVVAVAFLALFLISRRRFRITQTHETPRPDAPSAQGQGPNTKDRA